MSSVEQPHKVILKDVDISRHVISIDKFTDVGSVGGVGEISSAQIMLNSDFGRFTNVAPKVEQFNEFDIKVTSPYDANETYQRKMILDEIMPQTEEGGGYATTVQLYGREWWLTKVKMTGHYYFITFIDMIKEIIFRYNDNRKDAPEIVLDMDEVPPYTAGIFDFGYETSCYKALLSVQARLRLPVSGGGAGEYYEMRFDDINENRVRCSIFPYGGRKKSETMVTLNGKDIDTQYISETKQNVKGTVVVARGQADAGRYPKNIALWSNIIEEFTNAPEWDPETTYVKDALVQHKGTPFRATQNSTVGNAPEDGPQIWGRATEELDNFEYSPWTSGNAIHYANLASTATDIMPSEKPRRRGFPDSNLVVKDGAHYRNFADFRVRSPEQIHDDFLLDEEIPNDLRVLVDSTKGALEGAFAENHGAGAGRDKFGNPYKNAIVQYRRGIHDPEGDWIVIHNSKLYDECTVLDESRVYVFGKDVRIGGRDDRLSYRRTLQKETGSLLNPRDPTDTQNFIWIKMDKHYLGHDCFHQATSVEHDSMNDHNSLLNANLVNPEVLGYTVPLKPSAVKIEYNFRGLTGNSLYSQEVYNAQFRPSGGGQWLTETFLNFVRGAGAADFFIQDSAYRYGWWGTLFQAPFPRKKVGTTKVGSIFKQPVLDLKNLNYTSRGSQGWGYESSDDLGQITGLHFLFKFQYTFSDGNKNIPFTGNMPFRVTMYDTEDNVWTSDFVYRFLGDTQQVILPFSAFRIYRARNPTALSIDDAIQNILTPDLKVLEIFETRKIKMITLQLQTSYDSAGRYSPFNANRYFVNLGASLFGSTPRFTGWFDAVGFVKAPVAQARREVGEGVTDDIPYHIMPDIKDYPRVSSQSQLQKIANAELELAEFRFDDYVLKTTGRCDLRAGDAVLVHDDDIVDTIYAPEGSIPAEWKENTKRLSVRKINYTVNASDGPSGFVRHVTVQDRIGNPEVKKG